MRRAERAEFHALLCSALEKLTAEDVLLYDAEGRPILRGSDQWNIGEAERRRRRLGGATSKDVLRDIPEASENRSRLAQRVQSMRDCHLSTGTALLLDSASARS
jgi:hypothetical protein